MPIFQDFQPEIHDIMEDDRENKVSMWVTSKAQSAIGPYANGGMILVYFNEAVDKVERIVEFVDYAYVKKFFGRLGKYMIEKL